LLILLFTSSGYLLLAGSTFYIMLKFTPTSTLKRLKNRYRLVIINDDTYEEIVTFKLSRSSVYVGMSILVVLLAGITIALLSFTNLKYLIPGYGRQTNLTEMRLLKMRTDSLEQVLVARQQYLDGVQKMLQGNTPGLPQDTISLESPETEKREKKRSKRHK
jgi:hypothetical protein